MTTTMQNLTIEFNYTGVVQVRGDIEDTPFLNHLASAISALDKAIIALKYKRERAAKFPRTKSTRLKKMPKTCE